VVRDQHTSDVVDSNSLAEACFFFQAEDGIRDPRPGVASSEPPARTLGWRSQELPERQSSRRRTVARRQGPSRAPGPGMAQEQDGELRIAYFQYPALPRRARAARYMQGGASRGHAARTG